MKARGRGSRRSGLSRVWLYAVCAGETWGGWPRWSARPRLRLPPRAAAGSVSLPRRPWPSDRNPCRARAMPAAGCRRPGRGPGSDARAAAAARAVQRGGPGRGAAARAGAGRGAAARAGDGRCAATGAGAGRGAATRGGPRRGAERRPQLCRGPGDDRPSRGRHPRAARGHRRRGVGCPPGPPAPPRGSSPPTRGPRPRRACGPRALPRCRPAARRPSRRGRARSRSVSGPGRARSAPLPTS